MSNEIVEYKSKQAIIPFAEAWKEAQIYAASGMINKDFRTPEACYVALRMSEQMGVDLFMLMQSLYRVHEKVGIEAKFAIAMINDSGIFGPLTYNISGDADDYGCFVSAKRRSDGIVVSGSRVTIGIAKAEGWYSKAGSKWKTMPEQMLRYRSATFFARTECPQVLLGMHTRDEIEDSGPEPVSSLPETYETVSEIPNIPMDAKPEPATGKVSFPALNICCNGACEYNDKNEMSGCKDFDNAKRQKNTDHDDPFILFCERWELAKPHTILASITKSLIDDAKAALGWKHGVESTEERWELIYNIFGLDGVAS